MLKIISSPPINSNILGVSFKKIIDNKIPDTGTRAVKTPAMDALTCLRPLNHKIKDMYVRNTP